MNFSTEITVQYAALPARPSNHPTAAATRRQLGLSPDRLIIATGHQAEFWHPGILVKYMLTEAVAERAGGEIAHLVVDQDANDFAMLDIPIRNRDDRLGVLRHRLTIQCEDTPVGEHPAFVPSPLPNGWRAASPSVKDGAKAIIDALNAHRSEPNAAVQIAAALADLMTPYAGRGHTLFASSLFDTDGGRWLLERMTDDPERCARCYNEALVATPEAGTPLTILDDRVELPLWRIEADGRRLKAWDDDVDRAAAGEIRLVPRALTLTAIMRLAVCDLFVHGLGGQTYDRATERWMSAWLGVSLQPIATASATMRLPFPEGSQELVDFDAARSNFRRLRHDPESQSGRLSAAKSRHLAAIDAAPHGSFERRDAYRSLHEWLKDAQRRRVEAFAQASQLLATAEGQRDDAPIVSRRTWAFPLYPPDDLQALRRMCRDRVLLNVPLQRESAGRG